MPNTVFTWVRNGRDLSKPCECGGIIRGYTVTPERSRKYLNHLMVCDGPTCDVMVVHEGTPKERRGRRIIF